MTTFLFRLPAYLTLLTALTLITTGCNRNAAHPKGMVQNPKPNIIFILADDLGYGDLGCYGQKVIQTPNIDRMATEGIRFTHCYAGSTVCAPSRSVLMTGQHTGHTTVRGNNGIGGVVGLGGAPGRIPLLHRDTTIAEVLKAAGYTTGMVGKWGLGEPDTEGLPNDQGFDEFFGFLNQRRAHFYYPEYIWKDTSKVVLRGNQNGAQKEYVHYLFTDYALDFISRHKNEPFFLYLPYTLPHDEYQIPDMGLYADSTHWAAEERAYAAMVTLMDEDVGRILQQLRGLGLDDNTIVFFCSDNGAAQFWQGRFDSSGSLRGRKRDLYEGGIRVPMIIRYPGKVAAGVSSTLPWYFADVLPTLASLAGVASPDNIDGTDISPAFLQNSSNWELPERHLYWEFYETGYQQAVRWKHWKGIKRPPELGWELYDLEKNPAEDHDISGQYPKVVARIDSLAASSHTPSPYFPADGEKMQQKH